MPPHQNQTKNQGSVATWEVLPTSFLKKGPSTKERKRGIDEGPTHREKNENSGESLRLSCKAKGRAVPVQHLTVLDRKISERMAAEPWGADTNFYGKTIAHKEYLIQNAVSYKKKHAAHTAHGVQHCRGYVRQTVLLEPDWLLVKHLKFLNFKPGNNLSTILEDVSCSRGCQLHQRLSLFFIGACKRDMQYVSEHSLWLFDAFAITASMHRDKYWDWLQWGGRDGLSITDVPSLLT